MTERDSKPGPHPFPSPAGRGAFNPFSLREKGGDEGKTTACFKHLLRKAGSADLNTIANLEASCFGTADGVFSLRQLRGLLHNPNAYWLLSLDGKAMACWLKSGNGRARWARLYSLAVHPALRGQGFGKRLIEAGYIWMRAEGLTACRAEVKADNRAARRLYAGCGFRESGLLRDYYAPGVDGVRLVRTIT
jgi:ribosomal protein S18 acetylase RimI-like enzyme